MIEQLIEISYFCNHIFFNLNQPVETKYCQKNKWKELQNIPKELIFKLVNSHQKESWDVIDKIYYKRKTYTQI